MGVIPIIKTDNVSWIVAQKIRHYSIQYVQNILWTNIGIINILWPNIGIKNNIIGYLGCVTIQDIKAKWRSIKCAVRKNNRGMVKEIKAIVNRKQY